MKKIFWLHIKKCAGTSLRKAMDSFYVQTDRKNPIAFIGLEKKYWNDNLNNYRIPLGEYDFKRCLFAREMMYTKEEWENMHKICFVRNPYDRLISCYNYLKVREKSLYALNFLPPKIGFYLFLNKIPKVLASKRNRHFATHVAPIYDDITDNYENILVDEIFKIECLGKEEIQMRLREIGINYVPRLNRTKTIKNQKKYYNNRNRRLVNKIYDKDVKYLDYERL